MITISVRHNFDEAMKRFSARVEKQVAHAAAVAINETAKEIQAAVRSEMRSKFSSPTNWTIKNVRVRYANKRALRAAVYIGDREYSGASLTPAKVLGHHFAGGRREIKNLERYLGKALGKWFFVPGAGAKLDRHGNISRGQIAQIMAQTKLGLDPASWKTKSKRSLANRRRAGHIFLVTKRSLRQSLPPGVWIDMGPPVGVRPLLIPIAVPHYRRRFDMPGIAKRIVARSFDRNFGKAFRQTMSSAR